MFLCANLPHIEVYVKKEYLYDLEKGHGELVEGLWVSVKSIQGRALYFETFLPEYGALFDKLPISAFVWKKDYEGNMPLTELQLWDCFSYDITIIQKVLLGGSMCKYMSPEKKWYRGHYWWTIDSCASSAMERDVSFSETPSQHKSFNIISLENGDIAAQPNNRIIWHDSSLTSEKLKQPDFKVCSQNYSVETEAKWKVGHTDEWQYKSLAEEKL